MTSSRTSGSSCTSERLVGILRLTHPFPSLVVSLATGAIAIVASGSVPVAARLTAAMLGLQVSIGALNDLVDASLDAGRKPGKPIPRGAATAGQARGIAVGGLAVASGLTLPSGSLALGALGIGAACGYGSGLRPSRTARGWRPLPVPLPPRPPSPWP